MKDLVFVLAHRVGLTRFIEFDYKKLQTGVKSICSKWILLNHNII